MLLAGALMFFVGWDVLFSKPTLRQGIVKELLYVPSKTVTAYTPMNGRRIGNHPITAAKQEQWIAVVRNDNEDYQVHCTAEHYNLLKVGDTLQYKKYEGEVFHIRYFAHYEDH